MRPSPRGPFKARRGKPMKKERATIPILNIINIPKLGSVRKLQTPARVCVSRIVDIWRKK